MGCYCPQCDSSESCTKDAYICQNIRLIDTIGLDDDGSYNINYNNQNITLSGFIYPIYNLFETIESNKINDV